MRARIDVSEIEEQTKIRAKYLRALENEEWGLLPGPTYAKSFLRAYAHALGLDERTLVEEYKERFEEPREAEWGEGARQQAPYTPRRVRFPTRPRVPAPGPSRSRAYVIAGACAGVVVLLLVIGAIAGPQSKGPGPASRASDHGRAHTGAHGHRASGHGNVAGAAGAAGAVAAAPGAAASGQITLTLRPTARVWVCLIGDQHRKLIPGTILLPERERPLTYRGRQFKLDLGDNAVEMTIDGRRQEVPPSARPIGFSISASGLKPLAASELPTCA